jgi:hypothetical protein
VLEMGRCSVSGLPAMPERLDSDGGVKVDLIHGYIKIEVTSGGKAESIMISPYNAWRVFGMLSVLLGLRLPRAMAERIRL